MRDSRDNHNDELRRALLKARDLTAQGRNAVLAYLIEAALVELDEHPLDPSSVPGAPIRGVA